MTAHTRTSQGSRRWLAGLSLARVASWLTSSHQLAASSRFPCVGREPAAIRFLGRHGPYPQAVLRASCKPRHPQGPQLLTPSHWALRPQQMHFPGEEGADTDIRPRNPALCHLRPAGPLTVPRTLALDSSLHFHVIGQQQQAVPDKDRRTLQLPVNGTCGAFAKRDLHSHGCAVLSPLHGEMVGMERRLT